MPNQGPHPCHRLGMLVYRPVVVPVVWRMDRRPDRVVSLVVDVLLDRMVAPVSRRVVWLVVPVVVRCPDVPVSPVVWRTDVPPDRVVDVLLDRMAVPVSWPVVWLVVPVYRVLHLSTDLRVYLYLYRTVYVRVDRVVDVPVSLMLDRVSSRCRDLRYRCLTLDRSTAA